jgi:O-antigen/teichoic acid export membrane protein
MDRPFQFNLRTLLISITACAAAVSLALIAWQIPPGGPYIVSAAAAFTLAALSFYWNYASIKRLEHKEKPKTTGWYRFLCILGATAGLVLMFGFGLIGMAILYGLLLRLHNPLSFLSMHLMNRPV